MLKAKLGISPICWWNDDLVELSDDVSLEDCLRQASQAGYTGMETGRRFPMTIAELGPILNKYGISVCGGWFSGTVLEGDPHSVLEGMAIAAHAVGQDPLAFRLARLPAGSRHARVLKAVAEAAGWGSAPAGRFQGLAVHESFGTVVAEVVEAGVRREEKPLVMWDTGWFYGG